MKESLRTPPPRTPSQQLRPFPQDPEQWEAERTHALRTSRAVHFDASGTLPDDLVLVHERTRWGYLAWTVPGDGSLPQQPRRIGVLPPSPTRTERWAVRWLARRPAHRFGLPPTLPGSLKLSSIAVALVGLTVASFAVSQGIPAVFALPLAVLAPLLTDRLGHSLDVCAHRHVKIVEDESACRYLQRLAALHTHILEAAADSKTYELRRSAEIGHNQLWRAANLLARHSTQAVSDELIAREQLLLQLALQVNGIIAAASDRSDEADGADPDRGRPTPGAPLPKGYTLSGVPQPEHRHPVRDDVYLLFAHEPYYLDDTREINTTLVPAASLLHTGVLQPDGAQIHDRLTRGRRPGEVVPLAILTHELDGGAGWYKVGDWEIVTEDLVGLVRAGKCGALSFGLPEIPRALICTAPHSHVRSFDPLAEQSITYGETDRAAILAALSERTTEARAAHRLWPGDDLLPPLNQRG
ncbi:hypothetical protein ACWDBO_45115 [Streptomyces mirabilis]|uniref:hypothetical protein n=1 Tax=Streptomyces mirabilis TaxID=68239 RepID=UPI00332145BC